MKYWSTYLKLELIETYSILLNKELNYLGTILSVLKKFGVWITRIVCKNEFFVSFLIGRLLELSKPIRFCLDTLIMK